MAQRGRKPAVEPLVLLRPRPMICAGKSLVLFMSNEKRRYRNWFVGGAQRTSRAVGQCFGLEDEDLSVHVMLAVFYKASFLTLIAPKY